MKISYQEAESKAVEAIKKAIPISLKQNMLKESKGMFGVNIHHSSTTGASKEVGKWSAGCQVFQKIEDFNVFMALCEKHRLYYGNQFTYSLIDFRMINRAVKRRLAYGLGAAIGIGGLTYLFFKQVKKQLT